MNVSILLIEEMMPITFKKFAQGNSSQQKESGLSTLSLRDKMEETGIGNHGKMFHADETPECLLEAILIISSHS